MEISTDPWSSGLGTIENGEDCGKLEHSCLSKRDTAPKLLLVVTMWDQTVEPDMLILREMRNLDFTVNCPEF